MEPTNRSNVGNSTGGQNLPPVNSTPQTARSAGYDPIFSPTGRADVQSAPVTPTIISGPATPPPDPNHTASTATGDIILQKTPDQSNKPKLPLIIGLIMAGVLAIAGIAILVINPFGGKNSITTSSTTASFNKFMNYLYDGSDATGYNEDAYADDAVYSLEEMLDSDDRETRIEYFNTAQQLLDDVNNALQNDDITTDQQDLLNSLDQNLNVLKRITTVEQLTNEDITNYYLQNSAQKTQQYIQSYYATLLNSGSDDIKNYAQSLVDYQLWTVEYLSFLVNNHCVDKEINISCAESLEMSEESQEQQNNLETAYATASTLPYSSAATVINDSKQLASTLGIIDDDEYDEEEEE